MDATRKTRDNL